MRNTAILPKEEILGGSDMIECRGMLNYYQLPEMAESEVDINVDCDDVIIRVTIRPEKN